MSAPVRSRRKAGAATLVRAILIAAGTAVTLGAIASETTAPAPGGPTVLAETGLLPKGTRLGALTINQPRQILKVEAAGREQNYLVALGNMAFSAPDILGGVARAAGISCATCHSSGEINREFFIPGLSAHPGSADVSDALFNPKAADGIANPLDIPSLRGIAVTAPYGRDGRLASLREFTRNVIVNEFAGPEPSPLILDALEAYQREFDFLPNPWLTTGGRLVASAAAPARRGEALFRAPFATLDGKSCASCHVPSAAFTDGLRHDIGTGGHFVTPTLLNANDTNPYFHDGRAADYRTVLDHFEAMFGLGLDEAALADLEAYLQAIGHGEAPFERQDFAFDLHEVRIFASTLGPSIAGRDAPTTALTVATINREMREMRERWPNLADRPIRARLADWILAMRRVGLATEAGQWEEAARQLAAWHELVDADTPLVMAAEGRSLYDPVLRDAYLAERERLAILAQGGIE